MADTKMTNPHLDEGGVGSIFTDLRDLYKQGRQEFGATVFPVLTMRTGIREGGEEAAKALRRKKAALDAYKKAQEFEKKKVDELARVAATVKQGLAEATGRTVIGPVIRRVRELLPIRAEGIPMLPILLIAGVGVAALMLRRR